MDEKSLSEVELIEQVAMKMAKRLSLTYVADPEKRRTFEASHAGAGSQFGRQPADMDRKRA